MRHSHEKGHLFALSSEWLKEGDRTKKKQLKFEVVRFPFRDTAKLCDLMMPFFFLHFYTAIRWWIEQFGHFLPFCMHIFAWLSNLYVCIVITLLLPQLIHSLSRACQHQFSMHSLFQSLFLQLMFFTIGGLYSLCRINWCVFSEKAN